MEFNHCPSCGVSVSPDAKFCRSCGTELRIMKSKPQKRKNQYDERVKDWFTSKTFKTILIIGLIGGCCFGACSFLYYGSLIGLLSNLLSLPPEYQSSISTQQPHITDETSKNNPTSIPTQQVDHVLQQPYIAGETSASHPIDESTKSALNTWLATSAPADTPYWFVTYWNREEDGYIFVSLAGVRLSSPDEKWHLVDDVGTENKVMWIGSVEVFGDNVKLYQP
jgi:hypothetical protein